MRELLNIKYPSLPCLDKMFGEERRAERRPSLLSRSHKIDSVVSCFELKELMIMCHLQELTKFYCP